MTLTSPRRVACLGMVYTVPARRLPPKLGTLDSQGLSPGSWTPAGPGGWRVADVQVGLPSLAAWYLVARSCVAVLRFEDSSGPSLVAGRADGEEGEGGTGA